MARRKPLFPFATHNHPPKVIEDDPRPVTPSTETRRELAMEKLLRRAMRRNWQPVLPDDDENMINRDRAAICRLLRMPDPLQ